MSKNAIPLIAVFVFVGFSLVGVSAQEVPSPLAQINNGVHPTEVLCESGFQLIIRSNEKPACVMPSSTEILGSRGLVVFVGEVTPIEEPITPGKEAPDVIEATNRFMLDYYSLVSSEPDNVFFSPWSIVSAFSVVYEGANGQTAEEIGSAIYLPRDNSDRRDSFESLQQILNSNSSEYELQNANALWIQQGFGIKEDFVDTARNYYGSEAAEVSFPADESVIDSWVENKTNNKIKDLVKGKTNDMTRLVITNAVYFKGSWESPFNPNHTSQENFTLESDDTVEVPMMFQDSRFGYAENDQVQLLSIPYEGDRLSMLVLLPKGDLDSFEESLTLEQIQGWQEEVRPEKVMVYLPKFKLETEYELGNQMKDLGVELAFDPEQADLKGIADVSPQNLYIQFAVHKGFVEVNEEGTEAAAATGIGVGTTSAPAEPTIFRADHPFVFMIQDNDTGLVLFMGRVADPS